MRLKEWARWVVGCVLAAACGVLIASELCYHSLLPDGLPRDPPTPAAPFFAPDALWLDSCGGRGAPELPRSWPFPVLLLAGEPDEVCLATFAQRMLDPARRPRRALHRIPREVALATWIARHWTALETLQFVADNVWMGEGRHGLDAGAKFFFARPTAELTLAETAMLVALVRSPTGLDPRCHPGRARDARDAVLGRLFDAGRITAIQRAEAAAAPLGTFAGCPHRTHPPNTS